MSGHQMLNILIWCILGALLGSMGIHGWNLVLAISWIIILVISEKIEALAVVRGKKVTP